MKAAGIDPKFGQTAFQHDEGQRSLVCPAGKTMDYVGLSIKRGVRYQQDQARVEDCRSCAYRKSCCGPRQTGRLISIRLAENREVVAFRRKMNTPEAKKIYAQRGPTAEFPNCWIKEKLGLRKFRLRGLAKVTLEALWAVLTYDLLQWTRLRQHLSPAAA